MTTRAADLGIANVSIIWGMFDITKDWSGPVRGSTSGATPGFVVLSEMGKLPWKAAGERGERGERGGIYTWKDEMRWNLEADCFILTFSYRQGNE